MRCMRLMEGRPLSVLDVSVGWATTLRRKRPGGVGGSRASRRDPAAGCRLVWTRVPPQQDRRATRLLHAAEGGRQGPPPPAGGGGRGRGEGQGARPAGQEGGGQARAPARRRRRRQSAPGVEGRRRE